MSILRFPVVAFGFLVEQLRRLPGAELVERNASLAAAALLLAALVPLSVWMGTKAPERVSLADLVAGKLSDMQSWIVVSGDLAVQPSRTSTFRYRLTEPGVPNASMTIVSEVELPVGRTSVSGTFLGPHEPVPAGFEWLGQMRADPVLAQEPPVPWIAIVLAGAGLLVGVAGRFTYPMFFYEAPRPLVPGTMTLRVWARETAKSADAVVPGTLRVEPGAPLELHRQGGDEQPLRIYRAITSVDLGELRWLRRSEPVLRVRQPSGDLTVSFGSRHDRDGAFAALSATAEQQGQGWDGNGKV